MALQLVVRVKKFKPSFSAVFRFRVFDRDSVFAVKLVRAKWLANELSQKHDNQYYDTKVVKEREVGTFQLKMKTKKCFSHALKTIVPLRI